MRKIIAALGISLDGYIARSDGAVDFLFMPKDYSMAGFFQTIDTALLGRKTYEDGLKMGGTFGFGLKYYVLSKSLPAGERDSVVITRHSPKTIVSTLRKQKGKHIWLMGGGELIRDFLKYDLVDELHLGIVPVLIGSGRPLFPPEFPQRDFKLVENKTYSKGLITLQYRRAHRARTHA